MNIADIPAVLLIAGLALVYFALFLLFVVVLKSGRTIDIERRRPLETARPSTLTKLTNTARGVIDSRLRPGSGGYLSRARLDAAGLKKQAADYILLGGVVVLIAGVTGYILAGLFAALLLAVAGVLGLMVLMSRLISRRSTRFDEQVPDTLQMLTGGMRAGHSLLRSIDAAAKESEAPMAEELARIVNETRIGRDLGESLTSVAVRTRNEDFSWIAQAIEIHREVGGDLAEVLDHVGETIRDRNQIRRQVRALSAEGRTSAAVLISLPIVMFVALMFLNPSYAHTFTSTLPGYLMILAAVIMLALGAFWLSRLIKPKY